MTMLTQSSSIHAMSILADDMFAWVSFSLMVVITAFTLYTLARILDWSSEKPLPRVFQSSAFNVLFVGSAMVIAILLLRGIDLIGLFVKVGKPVVSDLVEGYALVVTLGLFGAILLIVVRRLRLGQSRPKRLRTSAILSYSDTKLLPFSVLVRPSPRSMSLSFSISSRCVRKRSEGRFTSF